MENLIFSIVVINHDPVQNIIIGNGKVSLIKISDTVFVIEYSDNSTSITVDIDCIYFENHENMINIRIKNPITNEQTFLKADFDDYNFLKKLIHESNEMIMMNLRLQIISRDFYYAGVYKELKQK